MTPTTSPAALTLHGYMDLPLDTKAVAGFCHYQPSEHGQVPGAGLIIGENEDGIVRVKCDDPRYWRRVEAAARENASFLEEAQRNGLAA